MLARIARRVVPALAVAVTAAAWAPPAQAYRLDGIPWPGRPATITYWNGTGYEQQVAQAARAWNRSGARVRFVAASKRRAQLRVVYEQRRRSSPYGLAHGSASVGYQPRNRIALSRGAVAPGVVGIIAHEFGHILGLVHDDRHCAVMNSVVWSRCAAPPTCSILRPDDVRGAIRRYGGRARPLPAELCPPAPAALAVQRLDGTERLLAAITMPSAEGVVGVIERHAVGRCPDSPDGVVRGQPGRAGSVVLVDVTPVGTLVGLDARVLCVRAWTFDGTGRISADAVTQEVALAAAAPG